MPETVPTTIAGDRATLLVGMWSAWVFVVLDVAYATAVVAAGAATGRPNDPYWAIAEVITIIGAVVLVTLLAVIHQCAPARSKAFSLVAFGWMLVWAGLTVTVHFVELTVVRRVDVTAIPGFSRLFDFEWPSLLYAIELLAWHMFLGLSLLSAGSAFRGPGKEAVVRIGLRVSGLLCLAGLIGPAVDNVNWRLIGVLGYGVVFPVVCIVIGLVFKDALSSRDISTHAGAPATGTI